MKICIPVTEERGMDSEVSEHFGKTPLFAFYDDEINELDNQGAVEAHLVCHHHHGHPFPRQGLHDVEDLAHHFRKYWLKGH